VSISSSDLRRELGRIFGSNVQRLERRPHAYRASFGLEALQLRLADGRELRMVHKDLSHRSLDANARRAKPPHLHDPVREIEVYAQMLAGHDLGTAAYYGAVVDRARDRYWLFLEDVPGIALWQEGEHATWLAVARWLAELHERVAPNGASLLRYDAEMQRRFLAQAVARLPPSAGELLAAAQERALSTFDAIPSALVHGDFYPSNVLVDTRGGRVRICALDWESAGVGPSLLDLASLVAGWPEHEVAALAGAYRSALAHPPPEDEFHHALDCCRLHVAVRWLGWSRRWRPPTEHAQDWSAAALDLAETLSG
jgi:hypothetical protein